MVLRWFYGIVTWIHVIWHMVLGPQTYFMRMAPPLMNIFLEFSASIGFFGEDMVTTHMEQYSLHIYLGRPP